MFDIFYIGGIYNISVIYTIVTIHLKTNTNHEENSWNFNF